MPTDVTLPWDNPEDQGDVPMFISPMLAKKLPEGFDPEPGEWAAEEKFDGHRMVIGVHNHRVHAWSRYGRDRELSRHVHQAMSEFPNIVPDGELFVPGGKSCGVTELTNADDLVYVIFDLMILEQQGVMAEPYLRRRERLEDLFNRPAIRKLNDSVILASTTLIETRKQLLALRDSVWKRQGEGLIVKRRNAIYIPAKRSKDWLKIKKVQYECCTLVGFVASKTVKQNRGPFAKVLLRDPYGIEFTVKTLNDEELANFAKHGPPDENHPDIGKKIYIEYQERYLDTGRYREPRWECWEWEWKERLVDGDQI